MRVPRLFLDAPLTPGAEVALDERAHRHAVQVLRLAPGSELILFDGRGGEYRARLVEAGRKGSRAVIDAFDARDTTPALCITLVQGVAKGDHMDLTLQKGTELGVSAFRPALTKRGLHLPAERLSSKSAHWQGVIVGACEQCGRTELPALHAPATLAQCLQETAGDELRLVLDPTAEHSLAALAARPVSITLVVGPEGGLAPEEIAEARHAGCTPVRLGPRILRTETACIAALTLAQARWGDLM